MKYNLYNDIWRCVLCKKHGKKIFSIMLVVFLVSTFAAATSKLPQSTVQVHEQPKTCGQIPTGKVVIVDDLVGVAKEVAIRDILRTAEKNSILKEKLKNVDFSKAIVKASLLRINGELVERTVVALPLNKDDGIVVVRDVKTSGAKIEFEREQYIGILLVSGKHTKILYDKGTIRPETIDWHCTSTVCTSDSQCPSGYVCTSACGDECMEWDTVCLYYAGLATGVSCDACLIGNVPACLACVLAVTNFPWACCEEWNKKCGERQWSPGH